MTDVALATAFTEEESAHMRGDFAILSRTVRDGKPLVYLDSGATSHKPRQVLDAEREFYEQHKLRGAPWCPPAGRGSHRRVRGCPRHGCPFHRCSAQEVVFTKNATEGLNLVTYAFSNAAAAGAMDGVDRRSPRGSPSGWATRS